jgi:hypothetical protein
MANTTETATSWTLDVWVDDEPNSRWERIDADTDTEDDAAVIDPIEAIENIFDRCENPGDYRLKMVDADGIEIAVATATVIEHSNGTYSVKDAEATTHNDDTLSGDCEIDCQERCAYPGQFTECEPGPAYYDTRDEVLRPEWMERDPDHFDDSANWPESWQ